MARMESDILATRPATTTGDMLTQSGAVMNFRVRIRDIHLVAGANAGSVVFRTGGSGGRTILTLNTAANEGSVDLGLSDCGILAEEGLHVTITDVASVVVFYA